MAYGNAVRRYFPGMKRPCPSCGEEITITEAMCARSQYTCGPCKSKRAVEYARRNRAKKRAWNNAYHARISDKRAERTRGYRERYPEKRLAHQAVQTALRNGQLKREPCTVCGDPKSHAHHDDYAKPLEVLWLCHTHHMERHAMLATRQEEPKS